MFVKDILNIQPVSEFSPFQSRISVRPISEPEVEQTSDPDPPYGGARPHGPDGGASGISVSSSPRFRRTLFARHGSSKFGNATNYN
jgi:hypothetical protein